MPLCCFRERLVVRLHVRPSRRPSRMSGKKPMLLSFYNLLSGALVFERRSHRRREISSMSNPQLLPLRLLFEVISRDDAFNTTIPQCGPANRPFEISNHLLEHISTDNILMMCFANSTSKKGQSSNCRALSALVFFIRTSGHCLSKSPRRRLQSRRCNLLFADSAFGRSSQRRRSSTRRTCKRSSRSKASFEASSKARHTRA